MFNQTFAPSSMFSPSVTVNVNYSEFKQSKGDKLLKANAIRAHKTSMRKAGYAPNKQLNIPEKQLVSSIHMTF